MVINPSVPAKTVPEFIAYAKANPGKINMGFVPGYEASQWYGVGAPKDTPAEVIDKLNNEINAVAADPLIKARLAGLGVNPMSMTSAEFGKFIADETEKWGKVIQALNIKAE
jgi:tripartite-type tricarboxylate transporter receptor subunit TctC